jgi:hypothetical protein
MLGKVRVRGVGLLAAWILCALAGLPAGASAASFAYRLHSHPDGNAAPPAYGLRLDGLVSGDGADIFTFNFDDPLSSVSLVYDDGSTPGLSDDTVHISGTVFGGLDTGSSYDPQLSGRWMLDFVYTANITSTGGDGSNIVVRGEDPANVGTITPVDVPGLPATSIPLVDEEGNFGFSFKFNNSENHRLDGTGLSGPETFVGYGWLNHSGEEHVKSSDWLFIGEVPEPSLLLLLGGLGLVPRLRRHRQAKAAL